MFDFNSTLEDINNNSSEIIDNILSSNMDIRCCFYGKYKLLLDMTPVGNTGFYKINNINHQFYKNPYSISDLYFEDILNQMPYRKGSCSVRNDCIDEFKVFSNMINSNINDINKIKLYSDGYFIIITMLSYDSKYGVFIKLNEHKDVDFENIYDNTFYDVLNDVNNGVFDFKSYYKNIIGSSINTIEDLPIYYGFQSLMRGYVIRFYHDIKVPNKFYFLFNFSVLNRKRAYNYDRLNRDIQTIIGINYNKNIRVDLFKSLYNKSNDTYASLKSLLSKKPRPVIVDTNNHKLEVKLTADLKNIPEYVINTVKTGSEYCKEYDENAIGMYEITVIE